MHKYYAELITGERKLINSTVADVLLRFHGYMQVMALPEFTIIKKGK